MEMRMTGEPDGTRAGPSPDRAQDASKQASRPPARAWSLAGPDRGVGAAGEGAGGIEGSGRLAKARLEAAQYKSPVSSARARDETLLTTRPVLHRSAPSLDSVRPVAAGGSAPRREPVTPAAIVRPTRSRYRRCQPETWRSECDSPTGSARRVSFAAS